MLFRQTIAQVNKALARIMHFLEAVYMTTQELNQKLDDLTGQVTKIGTETTANLALITELKAEIVAGQTVSQETVDKLNKLAAGIQAVDDLVPDAAPPAPSN